MTARSICLLLSLLTFASPAVAAPDCEDHTPGLHISYGFRVGSPYTDEEQEIFDKMYLRQNGINARDVSRTDDGCLEVFRRNENGQFVNEYYDPKTFELKLDLD